MDPDRESELRFRRLYDQYGAHIYAYFKRRTSDPRDCAADTFLIAWRRLDQIPPGDAALRWLYGVARNVLLNHWRSRRRFNRLTLKLAEQGQIAPCDPASIVVARADRSELIAALHRLPAKDQELLRLATWEELPHEAIGEILGCSAHAVDQRIYRVTGRLAREMDQAGHKRDMRTTPVIEPGDRVR